MNKNLERKDFIIYTIIAVVAIIAVKPVYNFLYTVMNYEVNILVGTSGSIYNVFNFIIKTEIIVTLIVLTIIAVKFDFLEAIRISFMLLILFALANILIAFAGAFIAAFAKSFLIK